MTRRKHRPPPTWEDTIKAFLGEVTYRLLKIGSIAGVGGLANLVVHRLTDNHVLNAAAMVVATGIAAAIRTRA